MVASQRFIALRVRRRYYDVERRQVISRRQYLKLHGIFPASRGVCSTVRHPRSDARCSRSSTQVGDKRSHPFVKLVHLPDGKVAEVHPVGGLHYRVFVGLVYIAPLLMEMCGTRRKWHCQMPGCSYYEKNQETIALHCYSVHYRELGCSGGRLPEKVWPTGEVRTNERRARMPWRVKL